MKEAVEDHRASSSRQPRSIYGKIVAEADRDIDVHEIFLRAIQYGKENNPDDDKEQQWERFSQHMDENIQETDTSGYGFPTPLTRKRSTNCAIS